MKSWRNVIKVHPAAEMFPLMGEGELRELGEDIRKNGLTSPIVIFSELMVPGDLSAGCKYALLDGRNRLNATVGIEFRLKRWGGKARGCRLESDKISMPRPSIINVDRLDLGDGVTPYDYGVSANLHRRHLTPEQRIELAEKLRKQQPGVPARRIAEQAGISPTTQTKIDRKLEAAGDVSTVDTSNGFWFISIPCSGSGR
jgi:hypothetical protein